jgi:hypothetical protein
MILNVAYTGSGQRLHVKGRVTETGYAGAALLEPSLSPTRHWFPQSAYLAYSSIDHLIHLIENISAEKIASCTELFSNIVRQKYNAAAIYGEMLKAINVVHPFSRTAA